MEAEARFGAQTEVRLRLERTRPGLLWLEAQRDGLLSTARPIVMLPAGHANLASEVAHLVSQPAELAPHASQSAENESGSRGQCRDQTLSEACCDDFLADLGLVLSQGKHSSSAAADLAHAWQCCLEERQENSSACSCCAATAAQPPTVSPCKLLVYSVTAL